MASIAMTGHLLSSTPTHSLSSRPPKTTTNSLVSFSTIPNSHNSRFSLRLTSIKASTFSFSPATLLPKIAPQNPNPISRQPKSPHPLFKLFTPLLSFLSGAGGFFSGGGSGGGAGGGGGGAGDGGGSHWSNFLCPQALADEKSQSEGWDSHGLPADIVVQLNRLSGLRKYRVSDVTFFDRRSGNTTSLEDDLFSEMVSLRPGEVYTKAQLQKELEFLASSGLFEKIDFEGKTKPDGTIGIRIPYIESTWQFANKFKCANVGLLPPSKNLEMDKDMSHMTEREIMEYMKKMERDYKKRIGQARPCMLPMSVQNEVLWMLKEHGKVSARMLQKMRAQVQKWYHDQGYKLANVVNFANLHTKEVVCEVAEGDITKVVIQFVDELGYVIEGKTKLPVVQRELPKQLREGSVYNVEAAGQAMRNLFSLNLFSNIEIQPLPDENDGFIVDIKLREAKPKLVDVDLNLKCDNLSLLHGSRTLDSIQPGGTVSVELQNLNGLNRSFLGSVATSNFLNPQDLGYKLEYVHPYLDGVNNPRNRTFRAICFNSRKLSPVFTSGPGEDEVPPIWVDRDGVKATITEDLTKQSKFTYGLVMENIATRDEFNHITARGQGALPGGEIRADGPPTTLSGTGVDRMVFAQANITRDNTKSVNGALVGERNIFQVDQGLGIGRSLPFFNRHQLTITKFLQLIQVEEGEGNRAPPTLVLHGHYAGCVGDLPSYDAFTLGGPYSVRGYNMGELGHARNMIEVAAELRVPIKKSTYAYAFGEHGNDLGSSKDVKGNPTGFYRKRGHGSSYGVGLKVGSFRAEYAIDHNSGKGAWFFRCGERF